MWMRALSLLLRESIQRFFHSGAGPPCRNSSLVSSRCCTSAGWIPRRLQILITLSDSNSASFQYRLPTARFSQGGASSSIGICETCRMRRCAGTKISPSEGVSTSPSSRRTVDLPSRRGPTTATSFPCGTLTWKRSIAGAVAPGYENDTPSTLMGMASVGNCVPVRRRSSASRSGERSSFVLLRRCLLTLLLLRRSVGRFMKTVMSWMGSTAFEMLISDVKMSLKPSPTSLMTPLVARKAPIWRSPWTTCCPP
mmetsp:Transcript_96739/g.269998  ORF Transcript_96739/g.269998 Transcript_96739/m.269998 type:complete len:253 (+) Transcript_96739:462-1220(+)